MEKSFDDMTHKEKSQAKKIAELLDIEGYVQFGLKYKEIRGKKIIDFFIVRGGKLKPKWGLLLEKGHGIEFRNCKFPESIKIEVKTYKYHLGFDKCTFLEFVECKKSVFSDEVKFVGCTFKEGVDFCAGQFVKSMCFKDCAFGGEVKLCNSKLLGEVDFSGSSFAKKANFSQTIFGDEKDSNDIVSFKHCVFSQGVDFSNARVHVSIYFNHAKFLGEVADFHESQFDKVACFYGVIIGGKAPNFSQAIFNGNLNFVNTNLNFGYRELKEQIGNSAKIANDYRDSFRLIKNNLLKNNNTLDASQYHKMELYCKEIELESKRQKSPSDWLEKWQLWFYRKTSDHHTNLLRIIACVVACIGLFGYVLLGIFASDEKIAEFVAKLNSAFIALVYCIFLHSSCYLFYGERWRKIVIYLCRILAVFFGVLILSLHPNYIINLLKGSLIDEHLFFAWWQNIILLVHVILLGLLLFSLQKTARKNSIIPS